MLAKQIMQKDLITILPSSTVYDAAVKMKEYHVGSVLIVDEGWKLKGILTDRDIAMTVAADLKDPKTTCVYDIMSADPITINSNEDFESALRVMNRAHIHRLPVTENGKLVGLLSSADLAAEMKEEFAQFIGLGVTFAKHTHYDGSKGQDLSPRQARVAVNNFSRSHEFAVERLLLSFQKQIIFTCGKLRR